MKFVTAALVILLASLALTSNHALVGDEPRSDATEKLVPLQVEREKIAAQFGANHPSVKQLDREIEMTRRSLAQSDVIEKLVPLQVEREKIAAQFGANHPSVKQLDQEIQLTRKFLLGAAATDDAKTLKSNGLLAAVQRLAQRVDSLERELAELKTRMPQTEPLNK